MIKFNIQLYKFFRKHKLFFFSFLTIICLILIYLGSKVQYEEDISKILPSTNIGSSENLVFNNIKVKDKIFVLISSTNDSLDTDRLEELSDEFSDRLLASDSCNNYIDNILSNIDENFFPSLINYLFDNIPVFIDSIDFNTLETLVSKENIDNQMAINFDILSSDAGMAFYDILRNDPIGFRNTFISKSNEIRDGLGGNFAMINRHFFTPDSTFAIAFISPNFKAFDSKTGTFLVEEMENVINDLKEDYPDADIIFHGAPIQSVFNSRQIKKDLMMTIGISLILIVIIIGICFKKLSTFLSLLSPVLFGAFFGLACMYLLFNNMSLLAIGIGALILAVGLSYCIHVLTHFKYTNDPVTVIKDQTIPIILSCITTVGAFLGMMFTSSDLLKDFGIFSSLSLIGCSLFCLLFLPQFFQTGKNKYSQKAFKVLGIINNYPLDNKKWLSFSIVIIFIICIFTSGRVVFDTDLRNIGYYDKMVMRSQNTMTEKTTPGLITKYYATTASTLDSAIYYFGQNTTQLQKLKDNNLISSFGQSGALLISTDEQQKRIDRWNNFWTQEKIQEVETNIERAGLSFDIMPEFFEPFFNMLDKQYVPVSLLESDVLPNSIMSNIVEKCDNTYMIFTPVQSKAENTFSISDATVKNNDHFIVIDPMYYTSDMVRIITNDFNTIVLISSIFVLIILLLHFKSIILALLAFLPMGISWYTVLGIMGIFHIEFNLINIVVSSFIFGVGVDYSLFIMDGLLSGTYKHDNKIILFHKTAIFFSAIALIICSIALTFAKHPALSSVGLVTLIGMVSTILTTYSLQPFIFNNLAQNKYTSKIVMKCSEKQNKRKYFKN